MNPAFAKASVYTDLQGLDKLRLEARRHAPGTLDKVAHQFESLFTEMMLKSMRKASFGDGIFDSQQTKFYRGMFDHQLALSLSSGRGLGIAAMLARQLRDGTGDQGPGTGINPGEPARSSCNDHTFRCGSNKDRFFPPVPGPQSPVPRK